MCAYHNTYKGFKEYKELVRGDCFCKNNGLLLKTSVFSKFLFYKAQNSAK